MGGINDAEDKIVKQNTCDVEEEIATLLSKHASFKSSSAHSFMSLRLLLLQAPPKRASEDNSAIETLKASYRNYVQSNKNEENIASLLVREWILIKSLNAGSFAAPSTQIVAPALGQETKIEQESRSNGGSQTMQLSHTNYALPVIH